MTFEEDFPSLKGEGFDITDQDNDGDFLFTDIDIQKHCLDKQKVLEKRIELYNKLVAIGTELAAPLIKELFKKFDTELGLE